MSRADMLNLHNDNSNEGRSPPQRSDGRVVLLLLGRHPAPVIRWFRFGHDIRSGLHELPNNLMISADASSQNRSALDQRIAEALDLLYLTVMFETDIQRMVYPSVFWPMIVAYRRRRK